ncbi:uncharacterized protein [Physcomitrium patens]|uniref:uncharacterized protein n=1 Tax=Physcomitrium patens TaxID=3218 RepID=UPI003CCE0E42
MMSAFSLAVIVESWVNVTGKEAQSKVKSCPNVRKFLSSSDEWLTRRGEGSRGSPESTKSTGGRTHGNRAPVAEIPRPSYIGDRRPWQGHEVEILQHEDPRAQKWVLWVRSSRRRSWSSELPVPHKHGSSPHQLFHLGSLLSVSSGFARPVKQVPVGSTTTHGTGLMSFLPTSTSADLSSGQGARNP